MKATLKLKALALAAMTLVGASSALAQQEFVTSNSTVFILGNTDSSNNLAEGVYIFSNDCSSGCSLSSVPQLRATANFLTDGTASINAASQINLTSSNSVSITATNTATLNATSVNVGSSGSTNTITGASNTINGTTNAINGTTNVNTSGTATTNIGNGDAAVNVSGNTSINTGAANTNTTSINTAGTGNVTIGNVGNTTSLNSSTNNIGVNAFATTNNIGTGSAVTTNSIGNTNSATTVTATAGNASQSLANNRASTLVTGGTSGLTARTGTANVATSAQVLLTNVGGTTVDANGKIITAGSTGYVAPTAPTAALTLTNGYGNTHGLVVTESQATLSGGTQSSSLTLSDTNARFSRASDGAPITVTGVADGRKDFDAVNVRQFANAVAAAAAQANVPALAAGQDRTFGLGLGNFMGKTALALGLHVRGDAKSTYRLSVSSGMSGGAKPVVGAGAAWSF